MRSQGGRTALYAGVTAVLAGGAVYSVVLAGRMAGFAAAAPAEQKAYLARLAWVCAVVAAMVAVAMVWVVMRFLSFRLTSGVKRTPTEHVDAWKLAGQRFKLTDEEEDRLESTWGDDEGK